MSVPRPDREAMPTIETIVTRRIPPIPWVEGDNIPWDDPAFSQRMLDEHLSQDNDLASRRVALIDEQVDWIHEALLGRTPSRILDLACGPGLYLQRLAPLGHAGVGLDFSPAAISYAKARAGELPLVYGCTDLRTADFGAGFDLALLLYGQLNVFRRTEAASILQKARAALNPEGLILIEPQRFDAVRSQALNPPTWSALPSGLFSDRPHLLLTETYWNEETRTGIERFFVVDAGSGVVSAYSMSTEAYQDEELADLLADAGFACSEIADGFVPAGQTKDLVALVGRG
jgi:SAM-dependent methyltransferase